MPIALNYMKSKWINSFFKGNICFNRFELNISFDWEKIFAMVVRIQLCTIKTFDLNTFFIML